MKKSIFRIFDYIVALVRNSFDLLSQKNEGAIELPASSKKRSKKTRFVYVQNLNKVELAPNEKITLLFNREQQRNHNYLFDGLTYRQKNRMISGRFQEKSNNGMNPSLYRFRRGDGTTFYV